MNTYTEGQMLTLLRERLLPAQTPGNGPRWVLTTHVRSAAGFDARRTLDAMAFDCWPSKGLEVHGFEVKCSRSDWLTELKKPEKAEEFKRYCHRFWLVAAHDRIVRDDLPPGWGLMVRVERDGREQLRVVRQAPKLAPDPLPHTMVVSAMRGVQTTASGASWRIGYQRAVDEAALNARDEQQRKYHEGTWLS